MQQFIAATGFVYAGRKMQPGEVFYPASQIDADILRQAGLATPMPPDEPLPYPDDDEPEPEPTGPDDSVTVTKRPRGRPRKIH